MPVPIPVTLRRSAAPLVLMALIFYLSAQPDLSTGLGLLDLIGRKLVHMAEYALLAALWYWALAPSSGRALPVAVAVAFFYAVSDEYHQTLVEGRNGTPVDVLIDLAGIAAAALAIRGAK